MWVGAQRYIDQNLKSLSGTDKENAHAGSNHSRFTVQKTHIHIGLEHPLLGVGTGLRQGYLREKLDKDPGWEIQNGMRILIIRECSVPDLPIWGISPFDLLKLDFWDLAFTCCRL